MAQMVGALIELCVWIVVFVFKVVFWLLRLLVRRRHLPPYQRALRRATDGAFVVTLTLYAGAWFPAWLGHSVGDLFSAFLRTPSNLAPAFLVYAGALAIGLLQLLTGILVARRGGDRDLMSAIWSGAVVIGCYCLMHWDWYAPPGYGFPGNLANIFIKGLYLAALAAALVRMWLSLPRSGNALKVVARHIERSAVVWRSARRS
jgi:hypothetical protein